MIVITITAQIAGSSRMYEAPGKQGRSKRIPAYRAMAYQPFNSAGHEFLVTRDTATQVFLGEPSEQRYREKSECPPNKPGVPYHARTCALANGSFCLRLHEPGIGVGRSQLKGVGPIIRTTILLHIGPATSHGCFMVTGGQRKLEALETWLSENNRAQEDILVFVTPR